MALFLFILNFFWLNIEIFIYIYLSFFCGICIYSFVIFFKISGSAAVIDKTLAKVKGPNKIIAGIYVHKFIAYHVASWIKPYYMLQIINILAKADTMHLEQELEEKNDTIDRLQAKMAQYKAELVAQMKAYSDESQRKLDRVLGQNDELKEQSDILHNDISELQETNQVIHNDIGRLGNNINVLHNDIGGCRRSYNGAPKMIFAIIKLYPDLASLERQNLQLLVDANTDDYDTVPEENMYHCIKKQRAGLDREKSKLLQSYHEISVIVEMEISRPSQFIELFWAEIEPYLFRSNLTKWEFTTFSGDDAELIAICQKIQSTR